MISGIMRKKNNNNWNINQQFFCFFLIFLLALSGNHDKLLNDNDTARLYKMAQTYLQLKNVIKQAISYYINKVIKKHARQPYVYHRKR